MRLFACLLVAALALPHHKLHQLHNVARSWFWEAYPPALRVTIINSTVSTCNAGNITNSAFIFADLIALPNLFVVPGLVTLSGVGQLTIDPAQLKLEVGIFKRFIDTWVEIPCSDAIGSCDYDDVCDVLSKLQIANCPSASCICPLHLGSFNLAGLTVNLTLPQMVPNWLTDGSFRFEFRLTNDNETVASCLRVEVQISLDTQGQEFDRVGARTRSWRFTHAVTHQEETESSCDPDTFLYQVCNLTSTDVTKGCPADYACAKITCPIPGLCWLPKNCTCDEDHSMQCVTDPSHKDECNTKFCGLCQATEKRSKLAAKEYFFRGSQSVPIFLSYENVESRFRLIKKMGEFGDDFEDIMD